MLNVKSQTFSFMNKLRVRKNRAKKDALYSVCSLLRRDAINRLKLRPGPSRPGSSPHAHRRNGLRLIRFAVSGDTGIIGPIKFPNSNKYNKPVPAIHESGGTVFTIGSVFKQLTFPKRPYMSKTVESRGPRLSKDFAIQLGRVL